MNFTEETLYWQIAVDAPLLGPLTYNDMALSQDERALLTRGVWVSIPLGNRLCQGLVLGPSNKPTGPFEIKSIQKINGELPIIHDSTIRWLEWLADYYLYPIGEITAGLLPPLEKSSKPRRQKKGQTVKVSDYEAPPLLTEEQRTIVENILTTSGFQSHLIYGVTGSGKTEIYMHVLAEFLARGLKGIVIVPEISLTPQLLNRFTARFGNRVATIHSHLTPREKTNQWWQMLEGERQILIGARSALFCPVSDLGVIIVDEEHEPSFKQDEYLKYHARDAAVMLGQIKNIPVLLGSATPSLESWNNACQGRYHLHRLRRRVEDRSMPQVEIVDLKAVRLIRKEKPSELPSWLSDELYREMQETLARQQQVAIFLNRRGFANVLQCPGCAFVVECPNCDISLTLHGKHHLICHYCDYQQILPNLCPSCHQSELLAMGLGTEQIELSLSQLFPLKKIARADRDEISTRSDIEDLINRMETGAIDILVGTQMIAKGLDFPNLNLVGIINSDIGLHLPDFRAAERTFQLITQVSGRAGRHVKKDEKPGAVLIQSYTPHHPAIQCAQTADFERFATEELENRRELMYPPFGKIAVVRIIGSKIEKVEVVAAQLAERSRELQRRFHPYKDLMVLGPSEYPIARIRNQFRFQILIKGAKSNVINTFVRQILGDRKWILSQVKVQVDIDPMNML